MQKMKTLILVLITGALLPLCSTYAQLGGGIIDLDSNCCMQGQEPSVSPGESTVLEENTNPELEPAFHNNNAFPTYENELAEDIVPIDVELDVPAIYNTNSITTLLYFIQVGAFKNIQNLNEYSDLQYIGRVYVEETNEGLYKVLVGVYYNEEEQSRAKNVLRRKGYKCFERTLKYEATHPNRAEIDLVEKFDNMYKVTF